MKSSARYKGLSKHQTDVLAQIALGNDLFHHPKTIEVLLKKGFITKGEQKVYGRGNTAIDCIPVIVSRYEMPISEHIQFCEWCAEEK
jgi:hypothetical protein